MGHLLYRMDKRGRVAEYLWRNRSMQRLKDRRRTTNFDLRQVRDILFRVIQTRKVMNASERATRSRAFFVCGIKIPRKE